MADAISDKLVSRHPHVFGDGQVKDAAEVLKQWAALKREEKRKKGGGLSALEGVPRELPALARADRLTEKASRVGFDWPDAAGARAKVTEELRELDEAVAAGRRPRSSVSWATRSSRWRTWPASWASPPRRRCAAPWGDSSPASRTWKQVLDRRGVAPGAATLAEMDMLWDEAKALEDQAKSAG